MLAKTDDFVRLSYVNSTRLFLPLNVMKESERFLLNTSNGTQINELLRQERIRCNWRQKDLAEQLGTTVVTVKRWERGYQQPSDYFRVKLCALFGKSAEELGLVDVNPPSPEDALETEQSSSSLVEPAGLWTVPYLRNPHFTGRDGLLEQLAQQLFPEKQNDQAQACRAVLNQPQAVKGLGGIGKTQIAVEYAYRSREQNCYTHFLWINAASQETITTSFLTLAERLPGFPAKDEKDQHKLIAAVLRWLQECQEPWLLIFDNADDLALVQSYVPPQGQGSILLTTRATAVAWLANSIEVEQMGLVEGTQFLLHRAQRLHPTDEECDEATNVVITLDGFPLALDQAGAYIEETGCGFGDYLQLYEQHRTTLLARRGKQAANYPDSVATTWSLSFQNVEQAHPAAADLLRLCAFLAPDHIPEEFLREGAPHWSPVLQEAVSDLLVFNQMLEDLLKFSLVKRLVEERTLSIHRLVQVVQCERMDSEEQRLWATRVVHGVNAVFPHNPKDEIATWPQCQRYLEQVQACDRLIQQYGLQFSEAADVLNRAGVYLREHALYTLAEPLYRRALYIWQQQLGAEHLQVASPLNNLANLYWNQGKYEQAEPLYLRALAIREQQLEAGHPDIAESLNNLATLYHNQGKYEQAELLYLRALAIREQRLGPQHAATATCLNNLANLYDIQGKYEQAEPLYLRALAIREQQLGPQHPSTALCLNNLAGLYYTQGKYEQTEPLVKRALQITEQQLGPQHPATAQSLNNLAVLYRTQGKYAQAEPLVKRALAIRTQQLGAQHPDTATSLNDLAELYRAQGKYEQAEPLYQRALAIYEQQLGEQHPDTVRSLNNLANLYVKQGKYAEAEPLYLRLLPILEQQVEFSLPELTAEIMHGFAFFRAVQGDRDEARIWYERALSIREQLFGPHHPKTKETRACFVALQQARGQHEVTACL